MQLITKFLEQNFFLKLALSSTFNTFLPNVPTIPPPLHFMATFCGWGSTASKLEPLQGGSLLFTTKSPEITGTHFIDLGRMKS